MLDEILKSRWKIPIKINPRKIKTIKLSGIINLIEIFEVLNNIQVNIENFISTKTNEMYKFKHTNRKKFIEKSSFYHRQFC